MNMYPRVRRSSSVMGILAVAGLVLTACSADDSNGAEEQDFGELEVPLSWLKTIEFSGLYFAEDNGYYEEAGFSSVNLVPGGPSATPSPIQVAAGQGLVAMSNPLVVGSVIAEEGDEADLRIIGSSYQRNAYTFVALEDTPLDSVEDLEGLRVGVQPVNEPVYNAFLEANGLSPEDVEMVSVQSDVTALVTGEVDAQIAFANNEVITLEEEGYEVNHLPFHDNGLPFAGGSVVTTQENIEENREALKAFLAASIRGWKEALEDHEGATETTVEHHAADQNLDYDHQLRASEEQVDFVLTEDAEANGLFTMTDELMEDTHAVIEVIGYEVDGDLFDMSLLEEVYEENPDLR